MYNGEDTIIRAINSCLKQTYRNIEILVVDNCSVDQTKKVVSDYMKQDSRIKLLDCPVKGRSKARNLGLDQAQGDYIQLLDADDTLSSNKIERAIDFFKNNPTESAYATAVQYLKSNNSWVITPRINFKHELLVHNVFPINSIIYKNVSTRFKSDLDYDEDWLFWVDLFYTQLKLPPVDSMIGGSVYVTGTNTMSNVALMMYYETIVRGLIKQMYPKNNSKIWLSDLKKMITINILFVESKIGKRELVQACRPFSFLNLVARGLIKIPIIRYKLINQVNSLLEKADYK